MDNSTERLAARLKAAAVVVFTVACFATPVLLIGTQVVAESLQVKLLPVYVAGVALPVSFVLLVVGHILAALHRIDANTRQ